MNSLSSELIEAISAQVRFALQTDIVSFGELRQIISDCGGKIELTIGVERVLQCLLTGDVQIGRAVNTGQNYVKFIAWQGNIADRVQRAFQEIERAQKNDRNFAFWLSFSRNVDEYESNLN